MIRCLLLPVVPANARRRLTVSVLLLVSAVFSGCVVPPADDPARMGPFFAPRNYTGEAHIPSNVRRVVVLPISGGSAAPAESVAALDAVFTAELQRQNRFEVVSLTRADCLRRFQAEEFPSVGVLPANLMTRLQQEFGADAVMFIDLTVFKPYRPIAIGVRAKLASIDNPVRLIWTFDNVYSTADAAVANSARAHFIDTDGGRIPADLTPSVLQSPAKFGTYVASSTFSTLPPVHPPAPATDAKETSEVAAPR